MVGERQNAVQLQESVADYASLTLKESLALFLDFWRAAVEFPKESENVHRLRVNSRRARAALELFQGFLAGRKAKRLLKQLDEVRKSAGPARDLSVFIQRIDDKSSEPDSRQPIRDYLQQQQHEARVTLQTHYLKGDSGDKLERRLAELLTTIRPRGRRNKEFNHQFREWACREMRSASRQFFADAEIDRDLVSLHEFRIRVKQFRYLLSLLQPAVPAEHFKKVASELKKLARRLGEINDHATALETFQQLAQIEFPGATQRDLRQWQKEERRALRGAVVEFERWWTPKRQRRLKRRIKRASRAHRDLCLAE